MKNDLFTGPLLSKILPRRSRIANPSCDCHRTSRWIGIFFFFFRLAAKGFIRYLRSVLSMAHVFLTEFIEILKVTRMSLQRDFD